MDGGVHTDFFSVEIYTKKLFSCHVMHARVGAASHENIAWH